MERSNARSIRADQLRGHAPAFVSNSALSLGISYRGNLQRALDETVCSRRNVKRPVNTTGRRTRGLPTTSTATISDSSSVGSAPHKATLYHIKHWSSSRVLHVVRALGLDKSGVVDVVEFDEPTFKADPYLQGRNPQGRLPFFEPGGQASPMVESQAIISYLVEMYDTDYEFSPKPVAQDSTDAEKARRRTFLQYLAFGPATAYHTVIPLFFATMGSGKPPQQWDSKEISRLVAVWDSTVVATLRMTLTDGRKYLLGSDYTVADMVISYDLMAASFTQQKQLFSDPLIAAYFERISSYPIFKDLYSVEKSS